MNLYSILLQLVKLLGVTQYFVHTLIADRTLRCIRVHPPWAAGCAAAGIIPTKVGGAGIPMISIPINFAILTGVIPPVVYPGIFWIILLYRTAREDSALYIVTARV